MKTSLKKWIWVVSKDAFYLSVNIFRKKILIGDTIFTSPTGDGTAILRGHPSHAKVQPHWQCKGVPSFLSYFKTLSNGPVPRIEPATALQSSALPTEQILPRIKFHRVYLTSGNLSPCRRSFLKLNS